MTTANLSAIINLQLLMHKIVKNLKGVHGKPCLHICENKAMKNNSKSVLVNTVTDQSSPTVIPVTRNRISHIYDKIFKKVLTLSGKSVVQFINGLFHTDHPLDSTITYNWTEHVDNDLNKTIADCIITINSTYSYHAEAMVYDDNEIEFRVFDYGFKHALKVRNGKDVLYFPEPHIIYLYNEKSISDEKIIILDFGRQGTFEYHVPVFKLMEHDLQYLDQHHMIILIPFMIMKLRKEIEKHRTPENMEALRTLILDDIISLIKKNQHVGNITLSDANRLRELIRQLYNYLYANYKEFDEGGLNEIMEDGLILECEIFEAEVTKKVTEQVTQQVTDDIICQLFQKLQNTEQVADLLDISNEYVVSVIQSQ